MGLSGIGQMFLLFSGELIGDSSFFVNIFPGVRKEFSKDKRELFLMPLFAIITVPAIIDIVLNITEVLRDLANLLCNCFADLEPCVKELKIYFVRICQMGCFSKFSYVFPYTFLYSKARRMFVKILRGAAKNILKSHDELFGIYVRDKFGTGYVLSEKWEAIYHCLYVIIIGNLLILGVLHWVYSDTKKSILNVKEWDMIPIAILTCMMEGANYLSAEERSWWKWLFHRSKKQAADCELNIFCLENAIKNYSGKKLVDVFCRRKYHEYDFEKKVQEYIDEERYDMDARIQYLLDYVEKESANRWISLHSIEVAKRLVKGENLFVTNLFYQDLDVAVFFPILMVLLRDEKALVMVEDNGNLEEIVQWLREGVEAIQDLTDFWTIDILQPMADNIDVGVLAFQEICKEDQLQWCMDFLGHVSYVVVIEASNLLAGGQDILMFLASRVGRREYSCTWLLCDKNAEGMVDLYSHLLDKEFSYVSATPYFAKESFVTYWNAESERVSEWSPVLRYLGVEAAIAEIAGRESVGKIHWYGEDMMPVKDLRGVWGQYYESYQKRTKKDIPYQMLIDDNVQVGVSGEGNNIRKQQFIVTEDNCFNLFEKGRQYATRAFNKICVCIISPNYMLRDYMKANCEIMEKDPKYISQFMPEHINSKRNMALRLIRRMLEEPVSVSEIIRIFEKDEEKLGDFHGIVTKELLREKIRLIFPVLQEIEIGITHTYCYSEQTRKIQRENYFQIIDEKVKEQFQKYFSQAVYVDETGATRYISKMMLGGHLDQKYARGQFVTFDGKYYEIIGKIMSEGKLALQVKRASDQIQKRKYYRMIRKYRINNASGNPPSDYPEQSDTAATMNIYEDQYYYIKRRCVDLGAETIGYVETADWGIIAGAKKELFSQNEERLYCNKQILKVALKSQDPTAVLLTAALTKEMFCTLYPQYYHLLDVAVKHEDFKAYLNAELEVVISDIENLSEKDNSFEKSNHPEKDNSFEKSNHSEKDNSFEKGNHSEKDNSSEKGNSCKKDYLPGSYFYIIEDSREDMGLLRSVERNVEKILKIQRNYMIWSRDNGSNYIEYGRR